MLNSPNSSVLIYNVEENFFSGFNNPHEQPVVQASLEMPPKKTLLINSNENKTNSSQNNENEHSNETDPQQQKVNSQPNENNTDPEQGSAVSSTKPNNPSFSSRKSATLVIKPETLKMKSRLSLKVPKVMPINENDSPTLEHRGAENEKDGKLGENGMAGHDAPTNDINYLEIAKNLGVTALDSPVLMKNLQRKNRRESVFQYLDNSFFGYYKEINSSAAKLKFFLKNTILLHSCAIFFTIAIIFLHREINSFCFYEKVCPCVSNYYLSKFYTGIREVFTNWVWITTGVYYGIFTLKEFNKNRFIQYCFYFVMLGVALGYYLYEDPKVTNDPATKALVIDWFLLVCFLAMIWRLRNWSLQYFIKRIKTPLGMLIIFYLFYTLINRAIPGTKASFKEVNRPGVNGYAVVVIISGHFIYFCFRWYVTKYHKFLLGEGTNFNALIVYSKIVNMWLVSLRMANLLDMDFEDWGFWLLLSDNVIYLFFVHYLGEAQITNLKKAVNKIMRRNIFHFHQQIFDENPEQDCNIFTAYQHIDFLFIFIPRMLILKLSNNWFSIASLNMQYSSNCKLEVANKFSMNYDKIFIFVLAEILFTTLFVYIERRNNLNSFNKYIKEEMSFLKRFILACAYHAGFEYYILVFQTH